MKKALCIFVCLCLLVPCAFAEELPRAIEESDGDYAWLYENSLVVAERFQYGLDCTWHSFLLSAANVPEQEMLDALAPLRMQDYNQPTAVTFVRADHLLPEAMIEAWQAALKAEEEAKALRAALRSAELVNELAVVKLANAEEAVLTAAEEAVKAAETAFKAAEEAAKLAEEEVVQEAEEEAVLPAKEIAQAAEEAFKAAEAAAQAVQELEKGEAFLAAKEAAKAAEKTSKMVKDAKKAAEEAAKAAAEEAEAEETANAAENAGKTEKTEKKEKTPAELAAETAAARIEAAVAAADKASKAAEEAFKAEANAIQAAQTLADLQAGKLTPDADDEADLEFSDDEELEDDAILPSGDGAETGSDADYWDLDWDDGLDGAASAGTGDDWDLDWDWDDWDLDNGEGSASAPQPEKKKIWFIEEDPQRDLYHCAPKVLNFNEDDKMFSGISDAIQVTGFYLREEALDGPHYAVMYYGGLYALLITYYPAGDGFVSVNCQIIYSRSADALFQP